MTLRDLPSVDTLIGSLADSLLDSGYNPPASLIRDAVRKAVDSARQSILQGSQPPATPFLMARSELRRLLCPSLRSVINATGVVLHTNLGRAPLPPIDTPAGYSNLEYDLVTGRRGKRDVHAGKLLEAILGAPSIVVNNNAAALYLILNELASGGETVVSRGELIEIGDGFRIPDIMSRSGTKLREVGTTNRTTIADYRDAIGPETKVLLRVHPSNFRITGFTARPELSELVALGREFGIPVYEDLGSGCVVDLKSFGVPEPLAQNSLKAGANLISFSGDKLLGGPQAGIIAGDAGLVARVRKNPMFRALRQDKLFFQVMASTLRHIVLEEFDEVPALRMIRMSADEIRSRAEALAQKIGPTVTVEPGESVIGGGSTPDLALPTWLLVVQDEAPNQVEKHLRGLDEPIIARIVNDRVVLDLRTVFEAQEPAIIAALKPKTTS